MPWELRFFSNKTNDYNKVEKWFRSIDDNFQTEKRDDMYIYSSKSLDLGIKIRQGTKNNNNKDGISKLPAKLEIKWRRRRSSRFQLLDGRVNGILEEWIKWGWNSGPNESNDDKVDFFSDVPRGPGITIAKDRSLRRYVFDKNKSVVRSTKWIKDGEDGLNCEITKITSRNTNWWSIGFEGFGNKHKNNREKFSYFLEKIIKDFPIRLEENSSCGYPEWISRNFA
jgi:hypothetical protein